MAVFIMTFDLLLNSSKVFLLPPFLGLIPALALNLINFKKKEEKKKKLFFDPDVEKNFTVLSIALYFILLFKALTFIPEETLKIIVSDWIFKTILVLCYINYLLSHYFKSKKAIEQKDQPNSSYSQSS